MAGPCGDSKSDLIQKGALAGDPAVSISHIGDGTIEVEGPYKNAQNQTEWLHKFAPPSPASGTISYENRNDQQTIITLEKGLTFDSDDILAKVRLVKGKQVMTDVDIALLSVSVSGQFNNFNNDYNYTGGMNVTDTLTIEALVTDADAITSIKGSVNRTNRYYFGVHQSPPAIGDSEGTKEAFIKTLSSELSTSRFTEKTFDCSVDGGDNFICMAVPHEDAVENFLFNTTTVLPIVMPDVTVDPSSNPAYEREYVLYVWPVALNSASIKILMQGTTPIP